MEKIVLRYGKKGYTLSQLEAAALAFAGEQGLENANMEIYHDFEELAVFGTDSRGQKCEAALPFSQLERWVKA